MITHAAIKVGNDVYIAPSGGGSCQHRAGFTKTRHCCVYNNNRVIYERVVAGEQTIQGFLTDKGEFLDRHQAMEYVIANGQPTTLPPQSGEMLFSEDLW